MFTRSEKLLLALCAAINFTNIVDFMILMPLGPQLMRIFSIDPHQFGLLVSTYTFAAGISGLMSSFFIDRFDRKRALLFFYLGFALGTIACALSRSYWPLLLARGLTGAFGGVISSIVLSIVSDAINLERRGTAMGIVMGAFSLASVLGVPFSLFLANHYDWHAPFMFLGISALLISMMVLAFLPSMRDHLKGPHQEGSDIFFSIRHLSKTPSQLYALFFLFCLVFGQFGVIPFLSPSFVSNGKLPEAHLPFIYLAGGIVSLFASPTFGRLSDRFGKKQVFYFGATASILPIIYITHLQASSEVVILLASSSFFLVMSGRMVPAMALISSAATPRYRGSFMSMTAAVQHLSAALASYVAGLMVARSVSGELLNYERVGWTAVAFTILALFAIRKVNPVE